MENYYNYAWLVFYLVGVIVGCGCGLIVGVFGRKKEFVGTLRVEPISGEEYLYLDMSVDIDELKTKRYARMLVDISEYQE